MRHRVLSAVRGILTGIAVAVVLTGCTSSDAQPGSSAHDGKARRPPRIDVPGPEPIVSTTEDHGIIINALSKAESSGAFRSSFQVSVFSDEQGRISKLQIRPEPTARSSITTEPERPAVEVLLSGPDGQRKAEYKSSAEKSTQAEPLTSAMAAEVIVWMLENRSTSHTWTCSYDPLDIEDNWFFLFVDWMPSKPDKTSILYCVKTEDALLVSTGTWPDVQN